MQPITPLINLSISDTGTDSADEAITMLANGCAAVVSNRDVALEVLLDLGCDPVWAEARIEHAVTGNWPIEAPLFP